MLDFVQKALQHDNIGFQRIDGQTTLPARTDALKKFRTEPNCRVMLASIGCAGEGHDFPLTISSLKSLTNIKLPSINLTCASYVHIMEPQWNPMAEAQAVDRVHRIGQDRDVVITRYLIKDSIEFVNAPLFPHPALTLYHTHRFLEMCSLKLMSI